MDWHATFFFFFFFFVLLQPLHVLPGLSLLHWVHGDTRDVPDTGDADYSMQI